MIQSTTINNRLSWFVSTKNYEQITNHSCFLFLVKIHDVLVCKFVKSKLNHRHSSLNNLFPCRDYSCSQRYIGEYSFSILREGGKRCLHTSYFITVSFNGLYIPLKLASRSHDLVAAAAAAKLEIRANAGDGPFGTAAGMSLFHCENIIYLNIQNKPAPFLYFVPLMGSQ